MKPIVLSALLALSSAAMADQAVDTQAAALDQVSLKPVSSNNQPDAQWFPDAGLGLFIHWGLASVGATNSASASFPRCARTMWMS